MNRPFRSIYSHGFLRVAAAVPRVALADPPVNAARTLALARLADERAAGLVVFPELGLSAYSNDDLFQQTALLEAVEREAAALAAASAKLAPLIVVGLPMRVEGRLFNCALVLHRGRPLGLVPKSFLPNYREFYEKRQFVAARDAVTDEVAFLGVRVPFGADLIFEARDYEGFNVHVELCEDLWVPAPPSNWAALAGATVLANLSASSATIGKADYRRLLCASQSAKCLAAYVMSAAGAGESTTDLAWDGHGLIYENQTLLAESERFSGEEQLIFGDVDLERLLADRIRMTSFNDCAGEHAERLRRMRRIPFEFGPPSGELPLEREVERFPFVPADRDRLAERCEEACRIQIQGLAQRLEATGIDKLVLGVSGGLDSTQSLLTAVRVCDRLGFPRSHVLGFSLPGFATTARTRGHAKRLMSSLGITAQEIDIRPSAERRLAEIGHPAAGGAPVYDVTFENVQAGERSALLFRLANQRGGLVVGTSDLSELALGWTTYGVGDHMSHYNPNSSIPKTLIRHLLRWTIRSGEFDAATRGVLEEILETEISPELVPGEDGGGQPAQRTEARVGPFDLQDFHLYFVSRFGFRPSKVAFLAEHAWGDARRGRWPDDIPADLRHDYDLPAIRSWLELFLRRFFGESQFKRSAMPNGPKVGSGGSLSPRGDWRAPSDAGAEPWLAELATHVPT